MAETSSLLELIASECPGSEVEVLEVGKYLVVGLGRDSEKLWIALDHQPSSQSVHTSS